MKKVGLISDTHGYFGEDVKEFLSDVDLILHCGDWGNIQTLEKVKAFKPVIGVYGNCDDQYIRMEVPLYQHFKIEDLECLMIHIGGYPARYDYQAWQLIQKLRPDIFLCGHSHILKVMNDPHFTKPEKFAANPKSTAKEDSKDPNDPLQKENLVKNQGSNGVSQADFPIAHQGSKEVSQNKIPIAHQGSKEVSQNKIPIAHQGSKDEVVLEDNIRKMLTMNPGACGMLGPHTVRTALRFKIDGSNITDLELGQWPR